MSELPLFLRMMEKQDTKQEASQPPFLFLIKNYRRTLMETSCHFFDIKTVSETGFFSGYASVYDVLDQQNDKVQRGAFQKSLETQTSPKMLWQHDPAQPIGRWEKVQEDSRGLYVEGRLFLSIQKAQEAYTLLKENVLEGLSIGYNVLQASRQKGHRLLEEVRLFEISLVTFPANPGARVLMVKGEDASEAEIQKILERIKREIRG